MNMTCWLMSKKLEQKINRIIFCNTLSFCQNILYLHIKARRSIIVKIRILFYALTSNVINDRKAYYSILQHRWLCNMNAIFYSIFVLLFVQNVHSEISLRKLYPLITPVLGNISIECRNASYNYVEHLSSALKASG